MARARLGHDEDRPGTREFQSRESGICRDPCERLGSGQSCRRQPAEIAASGAVDARNRALDVDVHDQIAANHVQPVRNQAETEVGSAAAVSADLAQPQVARGNSQGRDNSRQDGAKLTLGAGRIVYPIDIDARQIADDVSRETVGRAIEHERVGQRRERSDHVAERVQLRNALLGRRTASVKGCREKQPDEDPLRDEIPRARNATTLLPVLRHKSSLRPDFCPTLDRQAGPRAHSSVQNHLSARGNA